MIKMIIDNVEVICWGWGEMPPTDAGEIIEPEPRHVDCLVDNYIRGEIDSNLFVSQMDQLWAGECASYAMAPYRDEWVPAPVPNWRPKVERPLLQKVLGLSLLCFYLVPLVWILSEVW
jgi:hypothetical protein